MRQTYVISYDVSDPKRLRKVFKTMRGYGDPIQLSVFRCELSRRELVELRGALAKIIHHGEDQVLFVDVGPADGRAVTSFASLGRPYLHPDRIAIVV
jgi:CRISPR-associated protein Cas2